MKKIYLIIYVIVATAAMLSCNSAGKEETPNASSAPFNMQEAQRFIDSVNLKFTEQFKNLDSIALAAHYSTDAEMLFPNEEPIIGKNILSTWGSWIRSAIKDSTLDFTFTSTDLIGDNNFLIETGAFERKDTKKAVKSKGKYVAIWKQENGQWKLYRDIGM
jgi:ketosteroid isomerase-like protein